MGAKPTRLLQWSFVKHASAGRFRPNRRLHACGLLVTVGLFLAVPLVWTWAVQAQSGS